MIAAGPAMAVDHDAAPERRGEAGDGAAVPGWPSSDVSLRDEPGSADGEDGGPGDEDGPGREGDEELLWVVAGVGDRHVRPRRQPAAHRGQSAGEERFFDELHPHDAGDDGDGGAAGDGADGDAESAEERTGDDRPQPHMCGVTGEV